MELPQAHKVTLYRLWMIFPLRSHSDHVTFYSILETLSLHEADLWHRLKAALEPAPADLAILLRYPLLVP